MRKLVFFSLLVAAVPQLAPAIEPPPFDRHHQCREAIATNSNASVVQTPKKSRFRLSLFSLVFGLPTTAAVLLSPISYERQEMAYKEQNTGGVYFRGGDEFSDKELEDLDVRAEYFYVQARIKRVFAMTRNDMSHREFDPRPADFRRSLKFMVDRHPDAESLAKGIPLENDEDFIAFQGRYGHANKTFTWYGEINPLLVLNRGRIDTLTAALFEAEYQAFLRDPNLKDNLVSGGDRFLKGADWQAGWESLNASWLEEKPGTPFKRSHFLYDSDSKETLENREKEIVGVVISEAWEREGLDWKAKLWDHMEAANKDQLFLQALPQWESSYRPPTDREAFFSLLNRFDSPRHSDSHGIYRRLFLVFDLWTMNHPDRDAKTRRELLMEFIENQ